MTSTDMRHFNTKPVPAKTRHCSMHHTQYGTWIWVGKNIHIQSREFVLGAICVMTPLSQLLCMWLPASCQRGSGYYLKLLPSHLTCLPESSAGESSHFISLSFSSWGVRFTISGFISKRLFICSFGLGSPWTSTLSFTFGPKKNWQLVQTDTNHSCYVGSRLTRLPPCHQATIYIENSIKRRGLFIRSETL